MSRLWGLIAFVALALAGPAGAQAPSKIVVLLTDGRSNAGRIGPLEAADLAATLGIKVYTIGVGAAGCGGLSFH